MTYELCKRLKDAGFPQNFSPPFDYYYPDKEDNDDGISHCSGHTTDSGCYGLEVNDGLIEDWSFENKYDGKEVGVLLYSPTLSELIEACGEDFHNLNNGIRNRGKWYAAARIGVGEDSSERLLRSDDYDTPEEAVANLWLALNPKNDQ